MEENWKKISITGIDNITKCVGEFEVWEFYHIPYAKFKVKIYEDRNGKLKGYSNLKVIDKIGDYYQAIGYGNTIEETLENTVKYFMKLVSEVNEINENSFQYVNVTEF